MKKNKKNIRQQSAEKEKRNRFPEKKIDTLYAGIYKNCGNLEFLQTKISELKIQSGQEEQLAKQIKKDLTDLEEIVSVGIWKSKRTGTFAADTENRRSAETVSGSGKKAEKKKEI